MKKKSSGVIWGALLIFLGINIAGNTLFHVNLFFKGWWTLFIIIPCFIGLCNGNREKRTSNGIGLCIGLFFLFSALNVLPENWGFPLLVAGIFVIIGLKLISADRGRSGHRQEGAYDKRVKFYQEDSWMEEKEDVPYQQAEPFMQYSQSEGFEYSENTGNGEDTSFFKAQQKQEEWKRDESNSSGRGNQVACSAIFSGKSLKFEDDLFDGAMLSVVFGGMDLDLRRAVIRNDVTIEVKVIFGGLEILVPDYVKVIEDGVCIFGGVDNKAKAPSGTYDYVPVIYINSTCVFGGIDVK